MNEKLNEALNNLETTYQELVEMANQMVKPITENADKLIKFLEDHVENITTNQLRNKMLEVQLAAAAIAGVREKSARKAQLAEALQKEKYATSFGKAEGTAAAKSSFATLESQPEEIMEILYNLITNLIKAKVDQLHRLVNIMQSVLMSRRQESKYLNMSVTGEKDPDIPF